MDLRTNGSKNWSVYFGHLKFWALHLNLSFFNWYRISSITYQLQIFARIEAAKCSFDLSSNSLDITLLRSDRLLSRSIYSILLINNLSAVTSISDDYFGLLVDISLLKMLNINSKVT